MDSKTLSELGPELDEIRIFTTRCDVLQSLLDEAKEDLDDAIERLPGPPFSEFFPSGSPGPENIAEWNKFIDSLDSEFAKAEDAYDIKAAEEALAESDERIPWEKILSDTKDREDEVTKAVEATLPEPSFSAIASEIKKFKDAEKTLIIDIPGMPSEVISRLNAEGILTARKFYERFGPHISCAHLARVFGVSEDDVDTAHSAYFAHLYPPQGVSE